MITYKTGNLLAANTQALVNTVNTVGIMGKGIALQFKETFPENYRAYSAACKKGEVQIGKMFVTATNRMDGIKYIINFPTKKHWRHPSKLEYIRSGLIDLRKIIVEKNIQSVAMPPLGCGNGGLNWADVKQLIDYYLVDLPITLIVFEPSDEVNAILAAENEKREAKLHQRVL
ncbi:MAG: macro domain-containing protein [Lewinellaceae bacterium]|nr:macro domain-containing protein [Lewinellaceae bacterium]